MYDQKLKDLLISLVSTIKIDVLTQHIKTYYKQEYIEIKTLTTFLDDNCRYTERIYCIIHNIKIRPICITCHKNYPGFYSINKGYS